MTMTLPSSTTTRLLATAVAALVLVLSAPAAAQDDPDQTDPEQTDPEQTDAEATDGEQQADTGPSLRRGNRMEFDARLIRGESAGSGAVFLFERAQRPLPSMINKRTSFLRDTVGATLGDDWAAKFDQARNDDSDSE